MKFMAVFFFALVLFAAVRPAWADITEIQAREVARNNNCMPKKVSVMQQSLGTEGSTTYRIDCTMAKTTDENASKGADALMIRCRESMCTLVRPMAGENK